MPNAAVCQKQKKAGGTKVAQYSIQVMDTAVRSSRRITANGRNYAVVEVAYPAASFSPGQVLMLKTEDKDVRWPYGYMIQKRTGDGFVVVAPEHSDLYGRRAGDAVVAWGPRGRGPLDESGKTFLAVTEAAAYPACLPFVLKAAGQCKAVLFLDDKDGEPLLGEAAHFHRADSMEAAAAAAGQSKADCLLIALNPQKLLDFTQALDDEAVKKAIVYMPTVMVCGVGGCTSCAIHNPAAKTDPTAPPGVLMCCQGPYQPLDRVDIATDITTFELLS